MPALCQDCLTTCEPAARCAQCGSPRVVAHEELFDLSIAHVDCDAFYASVEKRDRPELASQPVIIGGGRRGVVSTACYIARIKGVRSAMPMFQALKLCPEAVVLPPDMKRYVAISRQIRALMDQLTPAVEPLSLDEAFLDLGGTERLHGAPAAITLARLAKQIREQIGVTVSLGLSHNKFLAKIASDFDKPAGFSVIGKAETQAFLAPQPVGMIWGIGPAAQASLDRAGIRQISDLLRWERRDLITRFGRMGDRLWHLARGQDARSVTANRPIKSLSNETTLSRDCADPDLLEAHLWRLSEKLSDRAKAQGIGGRVITVKAKRSNHQLLTRRHSLTQPTQLADVIYGAAQRLLRGMDNPGALRLIGVGISDLCPAEQADRLGDLLDPKAEKRAGAERVSDRIKARFGPEAIRIGRGLPKG